jgi:hypothetical protein
VASVHAQSTGNAYRVLWRHDGRQRSLTFENLRAAQRFWVMLESDGSDAALRIELDEVGRHIPTVTTWLTTTSTISPVLAGDEPERGGLENTLKPGGNQSARQQE